MMDDYERKNEREREQFTNSIKQAVTLAVNALREKSEGRVVIINNLHFHIQYATGGGASNVSAGENALHDDRHFSEPVTIQDFGREKDHGWISSLTRK